jgi:hypothetical protein
MVTYEQMPSDGGCTQEVNLEDVGETEGSYI